MPAFLDAEIRLDIAEAMLGSDEACDCVLKGPSFHVTLMANAA